LAGRPEAGQKESVRGRRSLSEGQLAANWVDCFADLVTSSGRRAEMAGDRRARLDRLRGRLGRQRRTALPCPRRGRARAPRLPQRIVLLEPAPQKSLAEWKASLGRLEGAPEVVVSDMDSAIARAVVELFPTAEHRWSEFHLKRSARNALPGRVLADAAHPVVEALELAFTAVPNYRAFERIVNDAAISEPDFQGRSSGSTATAHGSPPRPPHAPSPAPTRPAAARPPWAMSPGGSPPAPGA
jgi:hypothetical protein